MQLFCKRNRKRAGIIRLLMLYLLALLTVLDSEGILCQACSYSSRPAIADTSQLTISETTA